MNRDRECQALRLHGSPRPASPHLVSLPTVLALRGHGGPAGCRELEPAQRGVRLGGGGGNLGWVFPFPAPPSSPLLTGHRRLPMLCQGAAGGRPRSPRTGTPAPACCRGQGQLPVPSMVTTSQLLPQTDWVPFGSAPLISPRQDHVPTPQPWERPSCLFPSITPLCPRLPG